MINQHDIELMSPAGSFESLAAAIQGGADAVYVGIEKLNMRARSSFNFTTDDLEQIVAICKQHNIKAYLTLNTVIYESELAEAKKIIDLAYQKGVSAVIATDHAIINHAYQTGMSVHISTQTNISNSESVRFYAQYADVLVLARELTLDQIKSISQTIDKENIKGPSGYPVKLELFVHGALCMAISGKCYISLHQYNYSANRGACLQACRRGYTVTEKETGKELEIENEYIMSPKDICTIHFLNKILDSGIKILKIEGRARSAEYVKTTTRCYREAIDAYKAGSFSKEKINIWQKQLSTVFNRGFWDGYYLGQKIGEWSDVYGSKSVKRKEYTGKVNNYFTKIKVAEIIIETGYIQEGEDILIIGSTTGIIEMQVKEIRVDRKKVKSAKKGDVCSIPVSTFLRRSDKVYKWIER
ncbi:MAG: peptidase U32 family protein [Bacteroidota bacterium]